MRTEPIARGIFVVKNVSGAPLSIEEIDGHILADQETVDLMDPELPTFYSKHSAIVRAASSPDTKIGQHIVTGDIEIVQSVPECWEF